MFTYSVYIQHSYIFSIHSSILSIESFYSLDIAKSFKKLLVCIILTELVLCICHSNNAICLCGVFNSFIEVFISSIYLSRYHLVFQIHNDGVRMEPDPSSSLGVSWISEDWTHRTEFHQFRSRLLTRRHRAVELSGWRRLSSRYY